MVVDWFFLEESDIRECLNTIIPKMFEGFDRNPIKIAWDTHDQLIPTLAILFQKIYFQNTLPDQ